ESRAFTWYTDDDGMLVFKGRLPPEDGAVFVKAMESVLGYMNQEAFRRKREASQNTGKAISNITSLSQANEEVEKSTFPQKRAEALARMAEHYLATGKEGSMPLNGGDKYQVIVHINAGAVRASNEP